MAEIIIRGESAELAEIARLLRVLEQPAPSQDGSAAHRIAQIGVVLGRLLKPSEPTEPLLLAEQAVARLQGMRERMAELERLLQQRKGEAEQVAKLEKEREDIKTEQAAVEAELDHISEMCIERGVPRNHPAAGFLCVEDQVQMLLDRLEQERNTARGMADSYGTQLGELEAALSDLLGDRLQAGDDAPSTVEQVGMLVRLLQRERDDLQRDEDECHRILSGAGMPLMDGVGKVPTYGRIEALVKQRDALRAEVESITEDRDKALAFVDVQAERIDHLQHTVNEASRIMDAFWSAVERGGLTVVRDAVEAWQADDLDKVASIDFRDPVYDAEE